MEVIRSHRPAQSQSPEIDPSTLSNYQNFKIIQTNLHFDVLFDQKICKGQVGYELSVLNEVVDKLELDTSYLIIKSVQINKLEINDYVLHERSEPLGSKLSIPITKGLKSIIVTIDFETTEKCTALQFLDKEATDGKNHPYLFCQCQAIHARSLFPCFDTPAIKSTYKLSAKSPLFTLLSGRPVKQIDDIYYYDQPVPIPSYLISIASGDIVSAKIGPRSDVYSEPIKIKDCQWEFEKDMENFIQIAEHLIFEYEWLRFDSLILPSSFPYGGMEIPNLCQLTPTLICKDRSQVSVMAHELAHSWSGNLVTNCSWEHFWLNEGWTVYIERRILEGIAIAEARESKTIDMDPFVYGEAVRQFNAIIGWSDLENNLKSMGDNVETYSTLIQDLKQGQDPDDSFSSVPYEKGFNLLFHIEQKLGGKKVFDKFIPYYFKKFRYGSLDTYQFIDTLYGFFEDKHEILDSIDWNTWLYKPGMPPVNPNFDTTLADQCYDLADKWFSNIQGNTNSQFSSNDITKFDANQSVVFLETLISYNKRDDFKWKNHHDSLKSMEEIYQIYDKTLNAEVLFRWYVLQVTGERSEYLHRLGEWLGTVGRMKFVRPGYVLLNSVNHELAIEYFKKNEASYHPICKSMVKKDLGLVSNLSETFNLERIRGDLSSIQNSISKIKPPQEFFDFRRISKPANFGEVQSRVGFNLKYFQANYAAIVLVLSIYALITNLLLLFVTVFVVGGIIGINKLGGEDLRTPFGSYNTSQLYTGLLIVAIPLGFLASPISTMMWLIGSSSFSVLAHASFMEKPIETVFEEEV
ncbi:leukotriene A-4 hydrolase 2 [Scheffersomyces amazonensis]|uniref:leukotriene A-4 hydrolase 2 n=1 Tax=Scheffersomyces amazonensis TaxID=1078765 RepID=UPI00315CFB34